MAAQRIASKKKGSPREKTTLYTWRTEIRQPPAGSYKTAKVLKSLRGGKIFHRVDDSTERLIELGISEYQGWSKPNDVSVGRLCEHARLGHCDAEVPSHVRIFRRIDDYCVKQPSAANLCDKRVAAQFARQGVPKMGSLAASALHELLIFNNLQGYLCDARSDGVAPKG